MAITLYPVSSIEAADANWTTILDIAGSYPGKYVTGLKTSTNNAILNFNQANIPESSRFILESYSDFYASGSAQRTGSGYTYLYGTMVGARSMLITTNHYIYVTSVGYNTGSTLGSNTTQVGYSTRCTNTSGIATNLGTNTYSSYYGSFIGYGAIGTGYYGVGVGRNTYGNSYGCVSVGYNSYAYYYGAVALGPNTYAYNYAAIAIGSGASVRTNGTLTNSYSKVFGYYAQAQNNAEIFFKGSPNTTGGDYSTGAILCTMQRNTAAAGIGYNLSAYGTTTNNTYGLGLGRSSFQSIAVTAKITAKVSGGASSHWELTFVAGRSSGTYFMSTPILNTIVDPYGHTITCSNVTGDIRITVYPAVATSTNWQATISGVRVMTTT